MQTFLPYPDFALSASVLDSKRLGKQRVEAFQLLLANRDNWALKVYKEKHKKEYTSKAWQNHPAAKMWKGYNDALSMYLDVMISEWIKRGFRNSMLQRLLTKAEMPPWLDNENFHASHRSNLLRKDFQYYSQFNWSEPSSLPYIWP